jgi:hypothetical protein
MQLFTTFKKNFASYKEIIDIIDGSLFKMQELNFYFNNIKIAYGEKNYFDKNKLINDFMN